MKLLKIPTVTSDALDTGYAVIDVSTLTNISLTDDDLIIDGNGYTLTFVFDGTNAAQKLANVTAMYTYLISKLKDYFGDLHLLDRRERFIVKELFVGMTIAEIHTEVGLAREGAANTAIISVTLS